MSFRKYWKFLENIERKILLIREALPGRKYIFLISSGICALLLLASFLLYITAGAQRLDLFVIPVILAALFLRAKSFYFFPFAALGYYISISMGGIPSHIAFIKLSNEIVIWFVIAIIVLFAMKKLEDMQKVQERVKQDLDLAKALQKTLLSRAFNLSRIKVLSYIHQCMEVGGDFYFTRPFKKKYVVLSIGDVMGKGIPASLVMALIMGFFYEWGKKSYSPAFILDKINTRLIDLFGQGTWYSTLFYSIYDEGTGELTYSSAGHQKGLMINNEGTVSFLEAEGFPVGVFKGYEWVEKKLYLSPGDRVILFTDGVTEARNEKGEIFSFDRLLKLIENIKNQCLEDILQAILDEVKSHSGPNFESDDVALVMMEVKKPK